MVLKKDFSIDLSKTQKDDEEEADDGDYDVDGDEGEDGEEKNELKGMLQKRVANTWNESTAKREYVIGKLIKYFGALVVRTESSSGEENDGGYLYQKAPNAALNVVRARLVLKEHENIETKDFTIFISKRKWINNELRPLLELCSENKEDLDSDQNLTMRCCRLVLVLIKRIRTTADILSVAPRLKIGKETKEEGMDRFTKQSQSKANVMEQIAALISFKDALCTSKCAKAITYAFADCLRKESEATNEEIKGDLAACLSYLRRMLAIDTHPKASLPGDILAARNIHRKFIVHHKAILSTLPALCIDIKDKYHDDWFTDVIMIISYLLRGYEASDLFHIWKQGKLLSSSDLAHVEDLATLEETRKKPSSNGNGLHPPGSNVVRPDATNTTSHGMAARQAQDTKLKSSVASSSNSVIPMATGGGLLSRQLNMERSNRLKAAQTQNRFGGGLYRQTIGGGSLASAGASQSQSEATESAANSDAARVTLLRTPLISENYMHQAKRKRVKKNLTFADADPYDGVVDAGVSDRALTNAGCCVVATLVDSIVESAGLVQLVSRVNEDLRRGEDRVGLELELIYFKALSTMLHYNRLKLLDSRASTGWVPELQNVMKALDKMSFTRVVFTMERLHTKDKRFADIHIPMKLYKEMICYLRILLESDNSDHNEIAVAALYRLFYTAGTERQDPLPRLLSEWKPAAYPREHVNCLVELVTETLETLQVARSRFRNEDTNAAAFKKKGKDALKKGEMAIEQYIAASLRFSVDEYFRRLVSNHTVDLYTRLLTKFETNLPHINKHIFTFMWKMCNFELEQDYETLAPKTSLSLQLESGSQNVSRSNSLSEEFKTSDSLPELIPGAVSVAAAASVVVPGLGPALEKTAKPTLGHMLLNIQTLIAFSSVLNSPIAANQSHNLSTKSGLHASKTPEQLAEIAKIENISLLQRLGKSVVRRLEEAARKNHLIYVELLFSHPRPQEFCLTVDSIYEAPVYARYAESGAANPSSPELRGDKHRNDHKLGSDRHDDNTSSDEETQTKSKKMDFGDEFDEEDALFAAVDGKKSKKSKSQSQKISKKKKRDAQDSSDNNNSDSSDNGHRSKSRKSHELAKPGMKRGEWTKEEDSFLREQYSLYAGSKSVFNMIADAIRERNFGRHRSSASVAKRVQELRLHMSLHDDSSDDDEADPDMSDILQSESLSKNYSKKRNPETVQSSSLATSILAAPVSEADWDFDDSATIARSTEVPVQLSIPTAVVTKRKFAKKSHSVAAKEDSDEDIFGVADDVAAQAVGGPGSSLRLVGGSSYQIDSDDDDDDLFK